MTFSLFEYLLKFCFKDRVSFLENRHAEKHPVTILGKILEKRKIQQHNFHYQQILIFFK